MRLIALLFTALLLATPLANAQFGPPPCAGSLGLIRVSDIHRGKMDLFLRAVDAQAAWYQAHGMSDHLIYAARLQDPNQPGTTLLSDTQVMTFHYNWAPLSEVPTDTAFQTFVKMFQDSSSIRSETYVCTTKRL